MLSSIITDKDQRSHRPQGEVPRCESPGRPWPTVQRLALSDLDPSTRHERRLHSGAAPRRRSDINFQKQCTWGVRKACQHGVQQVMDHRCRWPSLHMRWSSYARWRGSDCWRSPPQRTDWENSPALASSVRSTMSTCVYALRVDSEC